MWLFLPSRTKKTFHSSSNLMIVHKIRSYNVKFCAHIHVRIRSYILQLDSPKYVEVCIILEVKQGKLVIGFLILWQNDLRVTSILWENFCMRFWWNSPPLFLFMFVFYCFLISFNHLLTTSSCPSFTFLNVFFPPFFFHFDYVPFLSAC